MNGALLQSVMLARLLGPLLLLASLGVLFNKAMVMSMMDEISSGKQKTVLFVSGFFTAFVGMVLVMMHNLWVGSWQVLITIVAWVMLLKGALLLLFPNWSVSLANTFKGKNGVMVLWGVIALVIGLVLSYYGYLV